jgi:hypothetical protein
MAKASTAKVIKLGGDVPTNGGDEAISFSEPFAVEVAIEGVADILFHRWNVEAVAEKAAAAKGSKAKKSDDIESYVYRDDAGMIALPGEYLRGAIINAAKYRQDPRSPRKSAMDLFKAGIVSLTPLASLGVEDWDYEHKCRVTIQRNGITRTRPALKAGWRATFVLSSVLPEYIPPQMLNEVIGAAGRLVGVGDFRPTYGRFSVVGFKVIN